MDLGRAANVKHHIILTDPIPFKERYRRIPPQLYDEVRNHLQEMLTIRNPEYTPSKKYFPLSISQFGEEDPSQFIFAPAARNSQP